MARIRTVKPEFWTSAQVMECSRDARLLFIGIWNFCDDKGRMVYMPKTIKAQVLPGDDVTADFVARLVDELSANGLVLIYTVDGKEYLQVTGWHHQKIDKPKESKLPPPPGESSATPRRTVATDLKGSEGKGEDQRAAASAARELDLGQPSTPEPSPQQSEESDLFRRGKQILGNNAGGLIAKLKTARGSVSLARATIETASTKHNPREYVSAVIRGQSEPSQGIDPGL
jgi:hypothetical protein